MEYRELGSTGRKVSVVGVGTWATGGWSWGGTDDARSLAAFDRAFELGIDFFDTAPVYGFGHSERVVGRAVAGRRDKVFLATKFGLVWNDKFEIGNDLSPASIERECDASLERLGVETIDLYQAHWPLQGDAMTRAVAEDMMATLEKLRAAGKVRHFGVSNFKVEHLKWCGGGARLASIQPPLSVLRPGAARELIPFCHAEKIGVVCYSPLFRGLLTGKYKGTETFPEDDSRSKHPDYSGETFKGICAAAGRLREIAEARGTTIAGVALQWVLSTSGVTVALAGTRGPEQIEEAARGAGWTMTPEERDLVTELFAPFAKVIL